MKKAPQIFTQETCEESSSQIQIRPFLKSVGCPKILASFRRKTRSQDPKQNFLKNEKRALDIDLKKKCANFQQNPKIFEVFTLPQDFRTD